MKKIAVVGAGTMGNGIAQVFALNHFEVHLIDRYEETLHSAMDTIALSLDRMIKRQIIDNDSKERILNRITVYTSLEEGVKDMKWVIEAVSEDVEIKKAVFKKLDANCSPETILASNTSSIPIATLAGATNRPDKVIGMHFMNPVPVMPLVEVIKGKDTSDETVKSILELTHDLYKKPIEANDFPGFVSNRILMPMINEAIEALEQGVATVDAIDGIMKLGMSHPMGPLQLADYIGLDICLSILGVLHEGFKNDKYKPNPLLVELVQAGKLGVKSGEGFYDYSKTQKAEVVSKRFM